MLDKGVPEEHNLAGVDVLVGAGPGMADIPSMAVVDIAVADTVHYGVCSHSEENTACSAQEVCIVVEG